MNYETPVWLDKIIVVTRGDKNKHQEKLFKTLKQLQEAPGYRASEKKSEFFLEETIWMEHKITEHGIKLNKEQIKARLQLKLPTSC